MAEEGTKVGEAYIEVDFVASAASKEKLVQDVQDAVQAASTTATGRGRGSRRGAVSPTGGSVGGGEAMVKLKADWASLQSSLSGHVFTIKAKFDLESLQTSINGHTFTISAKVGHVDETTAPTGAPRATHAANGGAQPFSTVARDAIPPELQQALKGHIQTSVDAIYKNISDAFETAGKGRFGTLSTEPGQQIEKAAELMGKFGSKFGDWVQMTTTKSGVERVTGGTMSPKALAQELGISASSPALVALRDNIKGMFNAQGGGSPSRGAEVFLSRVKSYAESLVAGAQGGAAPATAHHETQAVATQTARAVADVLPASELKELTKALGASRAERLTAVPFQPAIPTGVAGAGRPDTDPEATARAVRDLGGRNRADVRRRTRNPGDVDVPGFGSVNINGLLELARKGDVFGNVFERVGKQGPEGLVKFGAPGIVNEHGVAEPDEGAEQYLRDLSKKRGMVSIPGQEGRFHPLQRREAFLRAFLTQQGMGGEDTATLEALRAGFAPGTDIGNEITKALASGQNLGVAGFRETKRGQGQARMSGTADLGQMARTLMEELDAVDSRIQGTVETIGRTEEALSQSGLSKETRGDLQHKLQGLRARRTRLGGERDALAAFQQIFTGEPTMEQGRAMAAAGAIGGRENREAIAASKGLTPEERTEKLIRETIGGRTATRISEGELPTPEAIANAMAEHFFATADRRRTGSGKGKDVVLTSDQAMREAAYGPGGVATKPKGGAVGQIYEGFEGMGATQKKESRQYVSDVVTALLQDQRFRSGLTEEDARRKESMPRRRNVTQAEREAGLTGEGQFRYGPGQAAALEADIKRQQEKIARLEAGIAAGTPRAPRGRAETDAARAARLGTVPRLRGELELARYGGFNTETPPKFETGLAQMQQMAAASEARRAAEAVETTRSAATREKTLGRAAGKYVTGDTTMGIAAEHGVAGAQSEPGTGRFGEFNARYGGGMFAWDWQSPPGGRGRGTGGPGAPGGGPPGGGPGGEGEWGIPIPLPVIIVDSRIPLGGGGGGRGGKPPTGGEYGEPSAGLGAGRKTTAVNPYSIAMTRDARSIGLPRDAAAQENRRAREAELNAVRAQQNERAKGFDTLERNVARIFAGEEKRLKPVRPAYTAYPDQEREYQARGDQPVYTGNPTGGERRLLSALDETINPETRDRLRTRDENTMRRNARRAARGPMEEASVQDEEEERYRTRREERTRREARRARRLAPETTIGFENEAQQAFQDVAGRARVASRSIPRRGFGASLTDLITGGLSGRIGNPLEKQLAAQGRIDTELADLRQNLRGRSEAKYDEARAKLDLGSIDRDKNPQRWRVVNERLDEAQKSIKGFDAGITNSNKLIDEQVAIVKKNRGGAFGAAAVGSIGSIGIGAITFGIGNAIVTPLIEGVTQGITAALGPVLERVSGFSGTTGRVQTDVATQIRASNDNVAAALATIGTGARLNDQQLAAISGPLGARGQIVAGATSLAQQNDLFNTATNIVNQRNQFGQDRALFRSTGGLFDYNDFGGGRNGLFGTGILRDISIGGQPSVAEGLQGQLVNLSSIKDITRQLSTNPTIGDNLGIGDSFATRQHNDQVAATKMLEANNKQLDFLNANLKDFKLVQTGNTQVLQDQVKLFQNAGAAGLGSELFNKGVQVKGVTTQEDVGKFLQQFAEGPKLSVDAIIATLKPQLQVQEELRKSILELTLSQQGPQQAIALTEQGFGGSGAGTPSARGGINLSGLSSRDRKALNKDLDDTQKLYDQINKDVDAGTQKAKTFVTEQLGDEKGMQFATALGAASKYAKEISSIQLGVETKQAALAAQQYSYQIGIAKRNLADAKGLLTGTGNSLGALERQQYDLQRKSQALTLGQTQRQINFQRAVAGFTAPGLTGEERAARIEQAKIEADYAQKQLNIQKQLFGLSGRSFTITASRQVRDLVGQLGLLEKGRTLTIQTSVAEKRIRALSILADRENKKAEALYQSALDHAGDVLGVIAQIAIAADKSMAQVGARVLKEFYKTYTGMLAIINNGLGGSGESPRGNGKGGGGPIKTALGGIFMTNGVTPIGGDRIAGEAAGEAIVVLRSPTTSPMVSPQGGGSQVIQIILTGNKFSTKEEEDRMTRKIVDAVERAQARKGALLGAGR